LAAKIQNSNYKRSVAFYQLDLGEYQLIFIKKTMNCLSATHILTISAPIYLGQFN